MTRKRSDDHQDRKKGGSRQDKTAKPKKVKTAKRTSRQVRIGLGRGVHIQGNGNRVLHYKLSATPTGHLKPKPTKRGREGGDEGDAKEED